MRIRALFSLLGLVSAAGMAQPSDVPLTNWTVPPYRTSNASGGLSTMSDLSPGIGFVAVTPCRIVDTRGGGVFSGTYGPPALVGNAAARPFDINSAPHCTGIPAGAEAYSLNLTVIAAAGVFQNAFLTAWPTGGAQPVVSTLNFNAGQLVANAAIVPAGTNGSINVFVNAPGHLLIDINGYFTEEYNPGVSFHAVSNSATPALLAVNTSTASEAVAIQGVITTTTPGPSGVAAVKGFNQGTNNTGVGVWGKHNGGGWGVLGESAAGFGVVATTGGNAPNAAVWARTTSTASNSSGVYGSAITGIGVYGESASVLFGTTAGVFGTASGLVGGSYPPAGVRGESSVNGYGVMGLTNTGTNRGAVVGILHGTTVEGLLGVDGSPGDYGVFSRGDYGGTGAKYFVEPHPTDASKVIRYVSLEGNESGTYFRGRGKFQNGIATIEVPEDFRLVTDTEGLSIVATPIGPMATVSVASIGPERIVLRASRNVEFFYLVNGVRKTHKHLTPIGPGREYMPEAPDSKMPLYLTEGQKQMLISNGTYKSDGTVNMETAKRLGWDKEWEKRARPAPQASD